jgi:hypothetical protein
MISKLYKNIILFVAVLAGLDLMDARTGQACTRVTFDGVNTYSCIHERENVFEVKSDEPTFYANDITWEQYYYDLNENSVQNRKIKAIYKNTNSENGPFNYCNDRFGCRFIKRGGDEKLDKTERDSAEREIQRIKGEYSKDKVEMAQAAAEARSIDSIEDVKGALPRQVYENHVKTLTSEIKKDLPAIVKQNAETKSQNENYEKTVIPGKIKERNQLQEVNQANIAAGREGLKAASQSIDPVLTDIGQSFASNDAREKELNDLVKESAVQSTGGVQDFLQKRPSYTSDPVDAVDQIRRTGSAYRANNFSKLADRMDTMAVELDNFNKGNLLPYQGLRLTGNAAAEFGEGLLPDTFVGYQTIRLLNEAFNKPLIPFAEYPAIRDYYRILFKSVGTGVRSLGDFLVQVEVGYGLIDHTSHFMGGMVHNLAGYSDLAELALVPVGDLAGSLALAIYNYEDSWNAIAGSMATEWNLVKNCQSANRNNESCAYILGKYATDIAGVILGGVQGIKAGTALIKEASEAVAQAQISKLARMQKVAQTMGIEDGPQFVEFLDDVNRVIPCPGRNCGAGQDLANAVEVLDNAHLIGIKDHENVISLASSNIKALPPGMARRLDPRALEPKELVFANEILDHRSGNLVGTLKPNEPGIDGFYNGHPFQMKEIESADPRAVLRNTTKAVSSAVQAGYKGIDLFVKAPLISLDEMQKFALNGPLARIPNEGIIRSIDILTKDGWFRITGQ